jgi:hypothetical protein
MLAQLRHAVALRGPDSEARPRHEGIIVDGHNLQRPECR